jgi:hypothetical protein
MQLSEQRRVVGDETHRVAVGLVADDHEMPAQGQLKW